MARDHRNLRVFQEAHRLVIQIYRSTSTFPRDESFGLRMQMRRAAVSIPSNIVEGNARRSTGEYVNFLNIARGSSAELEYLLNLATELGFLSTEVGGQLLVPCGRIIAQIARLVQRMQLLATQEARPPR